MKLGFGDDNNHLTVIVEWRMTKILIVHPTITLRNNPSTLVCIMASLLTWFPIILSQIPCPLTLKPVAPIHHPSARILAIIAYIVDEFPVEFSHGMILVLDMG